jgi:hypothetical protein
MFEAVAVPLHGPRLRGGDIDLPSSTLSNPDAVHRIDA